MILPSQCVSALPAEEQRAPSLHCTRVPSLTLLLAVLAGHLTAALALLGWARHGGSLAGVAAAPLRLSVCGLLLLKHHPSGANQPGSSE